MSIELKDIGIVSYDRNEKENLLNARWSYNSPKGNVVSGTGIAKGLPKSSFVGTYSITYFDESGLNLDTFDLVITLNDQSYNLEWKKNDEVLYIGHGLLIDNKLIAGWRSS